MIPEVNVISGKVSVASVNGVRGPVGCSDPCNGDFKGEIPLRKW